MTFNVRLRCLHCGSDQFVQPSDPVPEEHQNRATCAACGRTFVVTTLMHELAKAAEKFGADALGGVLKR